MQVLRVPGGSTGGRPAGRLWSVVRLARTARALLLPLLLGTLAVTTAGRRAWAQDVLFTSASFNSGSMQAAWSHTVPAGGQNRYLVVGVSIRHTTRTPVVSNITFVTTAMAGANVTQMLARMGDATYPGEARVEIWGLPAPQTGTGTLTVRMDGTGGLVAGALSFTGVHQSASSGALVSNMGSGPTASLSVPSASGQAVVSVFASNGLIVPTARAPHLGRWAFQGLLMAAGGSEPGRTGMNVFWDAPGSTQPWLLGALSLYPAVAGVDGGPVDVAPDGSAPADAAPDVSSDLPDTAPAPSDVSADLPTPVDVAAEADGLGDAAPGYEANPAPVGGSGGASAGTAGTSGLAGAGGAGVADGSVPDDGRSDGSVAAHDNSYRIGCACSLQQHRPEGSGVAIASALAIGFLVRRRTSRRRR